MIEKWGAFICAQLNSDLLYAGNIIIKYLIGKITSYVTSFPFSYEKWDNIILYALCPTIEWAVQLGTYQDPNVVLQRRIRFTPPCLPRV